MTSLFIWITILISYIKLSISSSKWNVEYFDETSTTPSGTFTKTKGEYFIIKLKFSPPQGPGVTDIPPPVTGSLRTDSTDFKQLDDHLVMVDTMEERTYQVYLGVSCVAPLEYNKDYRITFSLDSIDETNKVNWNSIVIRLEEKMIPITLTLERPVIEQNSYSLFSISYIRNFNDLSIDLSSSNPKVKIKPYFITAFTPEARDHFKVYQQYSSIYSDNDSEYVATGTLDENSRKCFTLTTPTLKWKMSKVNLPNLMDKKELVLSDTDVDKSSTSTLQFHMKIDFKPVLISCGLSISHDMSKLTQDIVTQPLGQAKGNTLNQDYDLFQTYHQVEGTARIAFKRANRYSNGFTAVCYIQTLRFLSEYYIQDTMKIVLSNTGERDKTLELQSEQPFPSQCIIWKFSNTIDKTSFSSKIKPYCKEYFSKEKTLKERGCIICDTIETGESIAQTDIGLCIRADAACLINFQPQSASSTIKTEVTAFLNTINTADKLEEKIKIKTPHIEYIYFSGDDNEIDTDKIQVKINKLDRENVYLNIDTIKINNPLQCLIKPINKKPFDEVTEGDFDFGNQVLNIVPWKKDYKLSFTKEGYDNTTYNIIAMCYNFADYPYHARHTEPFILTTILRTNSEPIIVPPKERQKCGTKTVHPQCITYESKEIPNLFSDDYKPDISNELEDFARLSQGYNYLMIQDEYEEYLKVTVKSDIIDKTIYLLELLSMENCTSHTDYDYCRALKIKYMTSLLDNYIKLFPSSDISNDIESISAQHRQDIPLIAITLFDMTNNADSFNEPQYRKLIDFNQKIVDNHDKIIDIINKQQPASTLPDDVDRNEELKSNAKMDFTYVLFFSQVNLLDVTSYLEADKVESIYNGNDTLVDKSIKQIYDNIEKLIPYFALYGFRRVMYSNFYMQIYNKFLQENSDVYDINFDLFDIRVSIERRDLLKPQDVEFLFIYAIKKHPYLSHYATAFHPQSVSFRQYKLVDGKPKPSSTTTLDPNPIIVYNMLKSNASFTESFRFNEETGLFVNENSKLKIVIDNGIEYAHVIVSKVGDYTFGAPTSKGMTWIIIILAVVGGILLVGISYFVYAYIKKKKANQSINEINNPIMEG